MQHISDTLIRHGPYADHMAVNLASHGLFATPQANKAADVFDLQTGKLLHRLQALAIHMPSSIKAI
jgi:hypothetical protein